MSQAKRWLPVVICALAAMATVRAQAPEGVADQVLMIDVYSAMGGHQSSVSSTWLRADGTCFDLTRLRYSGHSDSGSLIGAGATSAGYGYSYSKRSANVARLTFQLPNPSGTAEYELTFRDASSGTLSGVSGPQLLSGTFRLRPAQFGIGPLNVSIRVQLTGGNPTIAGFVIPPMGTRFVLIRAIGPTLAKYGVANLAAQFQLAVYDSTGKPVKTTGWDPSPESTGTFSQLFELCGAFPLAISDGDQCGLVELPPGAYTAVVTAATPGNGLIEVYFLP